MVSNVHRRTIAVPAAVVGALLGTLSGEDERVWPGDWPRMRFDRPLGVGAVGGHGPVRDVVDQYEPGRSVRFRFTGPRGFRGHHGYRVEPQTATSSVLDHTLTMRVTGFARLSWPLFFRHLHDALIEESLDKVERQFAAETITPHQRSAVARTVVARIRDSRNRRHAGSVHDSS